MTWFWCLESLGFMLIFFPMRRWSQITAVVAPPVSNCSVGVAPFSNHFLSIHGLKDNFSLVEYHLGTNLLLFSETYLSDDVSNGSYLRL